jgi:hypothetical protein
VERHPPADLRVSRAASLTPTRLRLPIAVAVICGVTLSPGGDSVEQSTHFSE